MSLLLKTQARLMQRKISGAAATLPPSELLSKAALVMVNATEDFIYKIDRYEGRYDEPAIIEACNQALNVALTGDLIMAAAKVEQAKELAAEEAKLPTAENVVPFSEIAPEFPKP